MLVSWMIQCLLCINILFTVNAHIEIEIQSQKKLVILFDNCGVFHVFISEFAEIKLVVIKLLDN